MINAQASPHPDYDLVYISGSGRSGSTVLERILHSSDTVFACGEFHCLWRLGLNQMTCSCGQAVADDALWHAILDHAEIGPPQLAELERLEHRISRFGFLVRHRFNAKRLSRSPELLRFLELQQRIWTGIAAKTGARIIVDSSKAGPRAWIVSSLPQMHLVHLYRDPRDVIASWRSHKFDAGLKSTMQRLSVLRAAGDWLKVEMLTRLLARQRDVATVDYTQLCADPVATVERLAQQLDLGEPITARWKSRNSFTPGDNYHSLNGNPDRFVSGDVEIALRKPQLPNSLADALLTRFVGGMLRTVFPAPRAQTP